MQLYEKARRRFILWLAHRLPTCKDISRMVSDSMDQELPLRQRVEIKLHLRICTLCERYMRQLQFLRETMQQTTSHIERLDPFPTTSLSSKARERIKRSLGDTDQ